MTTKTSTPSRRDGSAGPRSAGPRNSACRRVPQPPALTAPARPQGRASATRTRSPVRLPHGRGRGRPPRGDRRAGLDRHRRHAVPGGQWRTKARAGLRRHPHRRSGHDLDRNDVIPPLRRRAPRQDLGAAAHVAVYNCDVLLGQTLMPPFTALLLGTLMYRSRLVPRIIPAPGLIGGPLLDRRRLRQLLGSVAPSPVSLAP